MNIKDILEQYIKDRYGFERVLVDEYNNIIIDVTDEIRYFGKIAGATKHSKSHIYNALKNYFLVEGYRIIYNFNGTLY